MNGTVTEWIGKADGDYRVAERELDAGDPSSYDAVCYHAQQCVEKMMKGVPVHYGVAPPKVHDLLQLSSLLTGAIPSWECTKQDLRWLTRAAMAFRYPGGSANRTHAEKAMAICTRVRSQLLTLLGREGKHLGGR